VSSLSNQLLSPSLLSRHVPNELSFGDSEGRPCHPVCSPLYLAVPQCQEIYPGSSVRMGCQSAMMIAM